MDTDNRPESINHGPDPMAPGDLVTVWWDNHADSFPGTTDDAAKLADLYGLAPQGTSTDGITRWA